LLYYNKQLHSNVIHLLATINFISQICMFV